VRRTPRPGILALALVAVVAATALVVGRLSTGAGSAADIAAPGEPGTVLLVPGYGGGTSGLSVLARALRADGRPTVLVRLPANGTGDLRVSAEALEAAAERALTEGASSVDVVGYSAGGLIARVWLQDEDRRHGVRRVITLGSPHRGTDLAALGLALAPESCPLGCRQLVPGSDLLAELAEDETPDGPEWMSLWTTQDDVVPPASARLDGAINVPLQELCPGVRVDHGGLPTARVVQAVVLQALAADELAEPTDDVCG
jgi:pimeloyl-ACP methyl ester carboxylesterase